MNAAAAQNDLFVDENFEKFREFHRANPAVYTLFQKYTFTAIEAGRTKYSARNIMERVRWDADIVIRGGGFKINNNFVPFYSKMFMQAYPQHNGFFNTRSRAAP